MDPGCWTGRVHLHIFNSTNTSLRDTGQFPPCRTASEACFTCTMNLETYTLTVSTTKIRLECLVSRWDLCRVGDRPCTCRRIHWQTLQHRLGSFHEGIHDSDSLKKTKQLYLSRWQQFTKSSFLVQLFSVIHRKLTVTEHKSRTWFDWLTD